MYIHYFKRAYQILRYEGIRSLILRTCAFLNKRQEIMSIWLEKNQCSKEWLTYQRQESKFFPYRPKISIILPTYNTPDNFLIECIESVLHQTYDNWELCIADDASTKTQVQILIKKYAALDNRIKYIFRNENGNICHSSNTAISLATGEFVGFLDHDDILWPNALFEVVSLLNKNKDADWIYSDEDKVTADGKTHIDPFFKPDWSPDLLYSFMYTGHFSVYRKSIVDKLNGFNVGLEYSQDYDLALRVSEVTNNIYHIPRILYSWRVYPESTAGGGKPYARKTNLQALENHLLRRGCRGKVLEYPFANKFQYEINADELVSIIIPSDNYKHSIVLIKSIFRKTNYKHFEILLVIKPEIGIKLKRKIADGRVKIIPFTKDFSFSAKCNLGAKEALGKYLIFLNDDIKILSEDWIERLIEFFQREEVGCVSPKLIYKNNTIQYAGMVNGIRGLIGTAFHTKPYLSTEYFNFIQSTRNVSILCGACFAINKDTYERVGGFNEIDTPVNHSDVDLSYKIRQQGMLIIYTPFATLLHYGHKSIGKSSKLEAKIIPDLYIIDRWGKYIAYDPYYPPQMRNYLYNHSYEDYKIIPKKIYDVIKFKKRYLFVLHELSLTGSSILLYWLAKGLKKHDIDVVFMAPGDGPLAKVLEKDNMTIIIDGEINKSISYATMRIFANFDMVLGNTILSWRAIIAAKEIGMPTLYYIHETPEYFNIDSSNSHLNGLEDNKKIYQAFKAASRVIYYYKDIADIYGNIIGDIRSELLLPGLEEVCYKEPANRKQNAFQILHVGSVEPRKGHKILVDAYFNLPKEVRENIYIVFVGNVLDAAYYAEIKDNIGVEKNICFKGVIPHEEVIKLYESSILYVCSSKTETGPLTVLEAMQNNVPVITTKVGITPELIKDRETGILINKDNPSELTEAILYFYNLDENEKNKIKDNAYKLIKEKYLLNNYVTNFMKIVAKL